MRLKWFVSCFFVALFCCSLMFLPGCNLFGPGGTESVSALLETPQVTTGDSSLKFNVVLPEPSVRASTSDSIRASGQSVTVTFSVNLIDTSTGNSWVVRQTVSVDDDGQANASFNSLPSVTVVGEIYIEGGHRGGYNEFHGAIDLKTGDNTIDVSPKGSGTLADITAKLVVQVKNSPNLLRNSPRDLATAVKNSAEQAGNNDNTLEKEKEALNNFVSNNVNQAAYVKLAIDNNNLNASGKSTWQKSLSELVDGINYSDPGWQLKEIVTQGFADSAYVAIKSTDASKFALLKIDTANGNVLNWLINEGNCEPVMVLADDSVLVGGTLAGKPIVFRWNGTANQTLTPASHALNKWATAIDVDGTATVPNPGVENFSLGVGDRLTCKLKDPLTGYPVTVVIDNNSGSIISTDRIPAPRVWAEGIPNAINIGWDLHANAKSYNLYYAPVDAELSQSSHSGKFTGVVPLYTHKDLPADTTYNYLVTWVDADGAEHDYSAFAKATAQAPRSIVGKWREENLPRIEESEGKRFATTKHHMFKNADGTYSELVEMHATNIGEDSPYLTGSIYSEGIYKVIGNRIERHLTYLEQTSTVAGGNTTVKKNYINIETGEIEVYDAGGKESGTLLESGTDIGLTEPGVFTFTYENGVLEMVGSAGTTRYVVLPEPQVQYTNVVGKWCEEGLPKNEERDGKRFTTTKNHMFKNADGTYSELVEIYATNIGEDDPYITASFYSEGTYEVIEDRIERHLTYLEQTSTPTGGETTVEKSYINNETGEVKVYDAGGKESGNLIRTETISTEPGVFTFTRDIGVLEIAGTAGTTRYVAFSDSQVYLVGILLSENSASIPTDETFNLADVQVTANFSDGSTKIVSDVSWAIKSGAGSIAEKVFTAPAQADTAVLECSYTMFGATKKAELAITITGDLNQDFAGGDGSAANPYQITNWVQLNNVRNYLDKHFILKNDLSSQTEGYNDYAAATANEGKGWSPIGYANAINFNGSFDGAGHKIIDLNIERNPEGLTTGLFGYVEGTIKNLTLENVNIKTIAHTGGDNSVGGIAGVITVEAKIDNCHVSGVITNENYNTGGIVGRALDKSIVSNCSNSASINGSSTTGGIAGSIEYRTDIVQASVVDCSNTGKITSEGTAGGISGSNVTYGIIDSCSNTGNVITATSYVGGIVGFSSGKISNCYSNAAIHNNEVESWSADAGGIAGSCSFVSNCYSLGSVTNSNKNGGAGGLVGYMTDEACIEKSFSQATVTGAGYGGGLVGMAHNWLGSISDCYSTGSVVSDRIAGGLVGGRGTYSESMIKNSYSTGKVTGLEESGGFCAPAWGNPVDSQASNCFWDMDTSEQNSSHGEEIGKTTSQMTQQATFTGWSFSSDAWSIIEGQSYPYLSWQNGANIPYASANNTPALTAIGLSETSASLLINATYNLADIQVTANFSDSSSKTVTDVSWAVKSGTGTISEKVFTAPAQAGTTVLECSYTESGTSKTAELTLTIAEEINQDFAGGDGSAANPYQITSWVQLNNVRNHLDKHFILKNDLSSQTEGYNDYAAATANDGKGWEPIATFYGNPFVGGFNGADYAINDLNICRDQDRIGLFGNVGGNTIIKNTALENVTISGIDWVGGMSGYISFSARIENCHVTGSVSGHKYVGGIVGSLKDNSIVSNCSNAAQVAARGSGSGAGGIAGVCFSSLSYNSNSGIITSEFLAGGIAGDNPGGIIEFCSNTGNVTVNTSINEARAGGIAASNSGKVVDCKSSAEIFIKTSSVRSHAGGIAGDSSGEIIRSYSMGSVISDSEQGTAGGVAGTIQSASTVTKSFSHATVSGSYIAGGLVGITNNADGSITDCYSTGSVVSNEYAGGLIGYYFGSSFYDYSTIIENCYASGKVTGGLDKAGGFAGYNSETKPTISCYWDMDTSDQITTKGDAVGKTTSQMTKQSTFTGWSFNSDAWSIIEGQSYPYLSWQNGANIPYASVPSTPDLTGISLSETSAALLTNATYNLADIQVTANFSDSSSKTVTDVSWAVKSGEGTISELVFTAPAQAGTTIVECSYTESDITKTAELELKIAAPNGILKGSVKDAVDSSALSGASVKAYDGETLIESVSTDSEGSYSLDLPGGIYYRIVISKADYRDVTYSNQLVEPSATVYLESVLQIAVQYSGTGTVSGKITDALTGQGLEGVLVELRAGVNAQTGEVITSTTTSSDGSYSFADLETGNYTAQVSKTGYVNSFYSVTCVGGETRDNQNHSISPIMEADEWRVVLTWDAEPWDLDSHMTGPNENSERFHVSYMNRNYSDSITEVDLDVDERYSWGPETITIRKQTSGVYRYSIHDFSNSSSSDSNKLSLSGASVKVYKGGDLIKTFNVPGGAGTLWTVFELDGNSLTSVNSMSYTSEPELVTSIRASAAASELHLFRDLPKK